MRSLFLCLVALAAGVTSANPLATNDQQWLDKYSLSLYHSDAFNSLREDARKQYIKTLKKYHVPITSQLSADIDKAADELVFSSIQKAANNDPANPRVYWTDTAPRTHDWFGLNVTGGRYSYDNPDCIYRIIPISDKYSYKLHGRRFNKGVSDLSFSLISNPNSQNTVNALFGKDLHVNDDGTYTITINSSDSHGPNHLQSKGNVVQLFVRHNLGDWSTETPDELKVEIVDKPKHFKHYTKKDTIAGAKENLKQSTFFYGFGALDFKTYSNPVNQIKSPEQSQLLGTLTSQAQSFAPYDLDDDEALVITLTKGKSDYFVVPVYTDGLITTDPAKRQVSLNNKQSFRNDNGSYTYVVTKNDPSVHNWLDTSGRKTGTLMIRWQGLETSGDGAKGIHVHSQVVKTDNLRKVLPKETKYLSAAQRKKQLQDRASNYARIHYQ